MISASCAASSASCGEAQSEPAKRCTCGCEPEITAASDGTSPSCAALITDSAGQDAGVMGIRASTARKGFSIGLGEPRRSVPVSELRERLERRLRHPAAGHHRAVPRLARGAIDQLELQELLDPRGAAGGPGGPGPPGPPAGGGGARGAPWSNTRPPGGTGPV